MKWGFPAGTILGVTSCVLFLAVAGCSKPVKERIVGAWTYSGSGYGPKGESGTMSKIEGELPAHQLFIDRGSDGKPSLVFIFRADKTVEVKRYYETLAGTYDIDSTERLLTITAKQTDPDGGIYQDAPGTVRSSEIEILSLSGDEMELAITYYAPESLYVTPTQPKRYMKARLFQHFRR